MVIADDTIAIPVNDTELKALKDGECMSWVFRTVEDVEVRIRVYVEHEDNEK